MGYYGAPQYQYQYQYYAAPRRVVRYAPNYLVPQYQAPYHRAPGYQVPNYQHRYAPQVQPQPVMTPPPASPVQYDFNKNGRHYTFRFQQRLNQAQLQNLYNNADYYERQYRQPAPRPEVQRPTVKPPVTPTPRREVPIPKQPSTPRPPENRVITPTPHTEPPVIKNVTPPVRPIPHTEPPETPPVKPKPHTDKPVVKTETPPVKPTPRVEQPVVKTETPPVRPTPRVEQPVVKTETPRTNPPTTPEVKEPDDPKTRHLTSPQKQKYADAQKKHAEMADRINTLKRELKSQEDELKRLKATAGDRKPATSDVATKGTDPEVRDRRRMEILEAETKQKADEIKKLEAGLKSAHDNLHNYGVVPKAQKMRFGATPHRWPENTQIVGTAREGQYSFMTRFSRTLNGAAEKTASLPEAIDRVENQPVMGDDTETQRPVTSSNKVGGWRKDDKTTPRRVLIVRGGHNEKDDKSGIDTDVNQYREMMAKQYGVPPENITVVDAKSKADVEAEMKKMREFSDTHPGAEAMVALVGHGWGEESSWAEPGLPSSEAGKEGAANGNFWLAGSTHLMENDLKDMFQKYMKGYKSVIGICNICSSGAWIADNRGTTPWEATV